MSLPSTERSTIERSTLERPTVDAGGQREPIAQSWHRVQRSGLAADATLGQAPTTAVDATSPLMLAAAPVLEQLEHRLGDTRYSLLLADRDCRIVRRWCDDRRAESLFDDLGARTGASFREEVVGTNALGTAHELRAGVRVHAGEHYAHQLQPFSCYGHPIWHPVTRRLEGVLDITGLAADANPLLAPLIARAVEDIEQRLLDVTRTSERALLAAFQSASGRRQRVLVAIGENVVLSNRAALDLLDPRDYAHLRALGDAGRTSMALAGGAVVRVTVSRVEGAGGGTLFTIEPPDPRRTRAPGPLRLVTGLPLLVSGPPGSGRTSRARAAATRDPVVVLDGGAAADRPLAWGRRLRDLLTGGEGTVVVDGIDTLPERLVTQVLESLASTTRPDLVLTSGPRDELSGAALTLASACVQQVELAPLAQRGSEMQILAAHAVRLANPAARLRLTPSVIEALAAQTWPGNLHELRAVMADVVAHRSTGDVVLADLPAAYRTTARAGLSGLQRAERATIVRVLGECDGNKARAARELGLSRTTLYARMRVLRISTW